MYVMFHHKSHIFYLIERRYANETYAIANMTFAENLCVIISFKVDKVMINPSLEFWARPNTGKAFSSLLALYQTAPLFVKTNYMLRTHTGKSGSDKYLTLSVVPFFLARCHCGFWFSFYFFLMQVPQVIVRKSAISVVRQRLIALISCWMAKKEG